ncbi:MAG: TatD family deoxyribonuclease [Erysipelotrichaceae bacterium]|nr:TatD family deoxyribonuclease [Erysipelotrichaceae bacterium]
MENSMKELYYIDTHVHLNDEKLLAHLDEVISDALNNNVKKMFVVGWDLESSKLAIELAHRYEFCYAIIGFHPCNIKGYSDFEYKWLDEHLSDEKVVALGEIGYDFHWDTTTKEEQDIAFIRQLDLAVKHKLPVSIHSRDAHQITFDVLSAYCDKLVGGVLHSYSGSTELAKEYVKRGFILGISGPLTFKNAKVNKEVVKEIDLKYLVSETDSPYLTPHPYRGSENGPKYIPLIVKEISLLKEFDENTVMEEIINNVKRVFGV